MSQFSMSAAEETAEMWRDASNYIRVRGMKASGEIATTLNEHAEMCDWEANRVLTLNRETEAIIRRILISKWGRRL